MSTASERLFFPLLQRKGSYPLKEDGSYYVYSFYREYVARDCEHRCVYCDSLASEIGGPEVMQLDHFRPESFAEYSHLVNDPLNLHYSCSRCNLLKSNHWPCRGSERSHNGRDGFVEPFGDDRLEYFTINVDGNLCEKQPPASYMIRVLRLNREFLCKLREYRQLKYLYIRRIEQMREKVVAGELPGREELVELLSAIEALLSE